MSTDPVLPRLLLSRKNDASTSDQIALITTFRTLERWAGQATVTSTGGGAGGYASLTGPGQTTTPGDLTQTGGFTINSTTQISLTNTSNNVFTIQQLGNGGMSIFSHNGLQLYSYAPNGGLEIVNDTALGPNPGTLQIVQNGTGSINISERGGQGVNIAAGNPLGGALLAGFITLTTGNNGGDLTLSMLNGYLVMSGLPTTNPGGTNRVWRNGSVLNIT